MCSSSNLITSCGRRGTSCASKHATRVAGPDGDIDDFIIDNVVVQYKTLDLSQQGIFNVRCYGAKGDGTPGDFGAILAARDALNAAGGGVLFFPPGTYVVHHTIELGANTTVLGSGPGSVLLAKPKDPGGPAFNMLLSATRTTCAFGISCSTATARSRPSRTRTRRTSVAGSSASRWMRARPACPSRMSSFATIIGPGSGSSARAPATTRTSRSRTKSR